MVTHAAGRHTRPVEVVTAVLAALDTVALQLYPAWLPEAAAIDSPAGAGIAAVRAVALRSPVGGAQLGPYLADLAERALISGGDPARVPGAAWAPEVQAAGLNRVIAASYRRTGMALLVPVPEGLSTESERALVAGARWLADWGGYGVWFTGTPFVAVDALESVPFWPAGTARPVEADRTAGTRYPALAGRPHPASRAERLLEAGLAGCDWAYGRAWNQDHQAHPLANPVRLDLVWHAERCVVEIDGPEHREPARFTADRQRDVLLQLAGYAVLRFTNGQVLDHRDRVMAQIHQFLTARRGAFVKGDPHARAEIVGTRAGGPADPHGRER